MCIQKTPNGPDGIGGASHQVEPPISVQILSKPPPVAGHELWNTQCACKGAAKTFESDLASVTHL
jgi:hypothetical protein